MATVVKESRPSSNHHKVEVIDVPEQSSSRRGWTISLIVTGILAVIGTTTFLVWRRLSADEE